MTQRETTSIRQAVAAAFGGDSPRAGRRRVVLAVSGGVDSMVLLDAAAATARLERLIVATFDHGTGPTATAARMFVEQRAKALGVECIGERAAEVLSSEAELRGARWQFLRRVASAANADVCTAHTADDQVETILMRALRDAGARGLAGLYAESSVVRPLLQIGRSEIVRYARAHRIRWVEDPSNQSPKYFRNRVRHDLLPALRRARPTIDVDLLSVAQTAAQWRREIESFVTDSIDLRESVGGLGLDVAAASLVSYSESELAALWPAVAARVGLVLDRRGTRRLSEFTKTGHIGRRIQLSGGWEVVRSRDAYQFRSSAHHKEPTPAGLELSNNTTWGAWSFRPANDPYHDSSETVKKAAAVETADGSWSSWLPTDRPLSVRAWKPGDAMSHSSGGPSRKIKRMLSDAGVTGHERARWPVVLAGDQIVWVPGVSRSIAATDRSGRPGLSFVCDYNNR